MSSAGVTWTDADGAAVSLPDTGYETHWGNAVLLTKSFLAAQTPGTYTVTFNMDGGNSPAATVTVPDTWKVSVVITPEDGGGIFADGSSSRLWESTYYVTKGEEASFDAGENYGYIFLRWKLNGEAVSEDWNYSFTPTADCTLEAVFEANRYEVAFDANGGEGSMDDQPFTYGAEQALSANAFAKAGHSFAGWNTAADGSGTAYTDGQSVKNLTAEEDGTVTLYAQWTVRTYTITWRDENGALIDRTEVEHGALPTHADAEKQSTLRYTYTFAGWTPVLADATCDAEYRATFSVEELLLGDVNHDGVVDGLDAALVLRYDAGLADGIDRLRGDVNFDGEVDNLDAALILQYDAGLLDTLWS